MNDSEREQLAQRLSALSLNDARKEILRLDRDANLKYWRNTIWDEYHSLFVLPNAGLSITLVEEQDRRGTDQADDSSANSRRRKNQKIAYDYIEARVTPLTRPATNSGGRV
jgi:hypothetical protein